MNKEFYEAREKARKQLMDAGEDEWFIDIALSWAYPVEFSDRLILP